MLRNSQKITTSISSQSCTNDNQWPQNQQVILDDQKTLMASSSSSLTNTKAMEKTNQDHQNQQQPPLRCPRCDSSNTKFCYYNNYSLSQPRHFCKACKRYWTRGGTLRNVPVGGGCRKNKRVKRQAGHGGAGDGISITSSSAAVNPSVAADLSTPASNHINNNSPLFYGLSTNPLELNFPFSSLGSTRVSSGGFDLQHQMNGLGLGFPGAVLPGEIPTSDPKNGFKHIQDVINASNSPYNFSSPGNNSIFYGSSTNFGGSTSTSTMASLLASGLQHPKFSAGNSNNHHLMPYGDNQMNGEMGKELKLEGDQNRLPFLNPNPQINSSDSSSIVWNTSNVAAWFDPSNVGSSSSVPSLI